MDIQQEKEKLKQSLKGRGFLVPKGARFFYSRNEDKVGMMVGSYTHSCHVETSDFYALLDSEGNLIRGDDLWWREI